MAKATNKNDYKALIVAQGKKAENIIISHSATRVYIVFNTHAFFSYPKDAVCTVHVNIIKKIGILNHVNTPGMYIKTASGEWIKDSDISPDCERFFVADAKPVFITDFSYDSSDNGIPLSIFITNNRFGTIDKAFGTILEAMYGYGGNALSDGTTESLVWAQSTDDTDTIFAAMPMRENPTRKQFFLSTFKTLAKVTI